MDKFFFDKAFYCIIAFSYMAMFVYACIKMFTLFFGPLFGRRKRRH